jgi:outer membrane protein
MKRAAHVWMWLGLLGVAPTAAQSAPSVKIGIINSRQILQQTPGYAAAESTFDREVKGFREEVQKLQRQMDSSIQAFDQQSIALSPAARQAKQKDLQTQQHHLEQRTTELQQRAQQREQELMAPIQARINAVIQGLRAEGNYAVIFDADAQGSNIIAADPALNLTPTVMGRLRTAQ